MPGCVKTSAARWGLRCYFEQARDAVRLVAWPEHFLELSGGISKEWAHSSTQSMRAEKVLDGLDSCFQHVRDLGCPCVPPLLFVSICKAQQQAASGCRGWYMGW